MQRARRMSSGVFPALLAERRTVPGLGACMVAKVERMHQHRREENFWNRKEEHRSQSVCLQVQYIPPKEQGV